MFMASFGSQIRRTVEEQASLVTELVEYVGLQHLGVNSKDLIVSHAMRSKALLVLDQHCLPGIDTSSKLSC